MKKKQKKVIKNILRILDIIIAQDNYNSFHEDRIKDATTKINKILKK